MSRNGIFPRYFTLNFPDTDRRSINPYEVREEIKKITGDYPVSITGESCSKLTIQVKSACQAVSIKNLCSIDNVSCVITEHRSFNQSKGLFFLREFDIVDVDQFRRDLIEAYDEIKNIEPAPFIKSSNSTAFIATFNSEQPPYSLYIPGERSDSQVKPFRSRPMLCKNCLVYGHTAKWCKQATSLCRRCSAPDHLESQCTAEQPNCHHCKEEHVTGTTQCPRWKDEQMVLETVEKVTRARAKQILQGQAIVTQTKQQKTFPTVFDCQMPTETKRKFSPFLLEKCIQSRIGSKPRSIRTQDKSCFTIEVSSFQESVDMMKITQLNGIPVNMSVNTSLGVQKGLIYVHGYNMSELESYCNSLKSQYNLVKVEDPVWIKPQGNRLSKALLLSFRGDLPTFIDIPGEIMRTKVYEYKKKPLLCTNCLEYGHSHSICRGSAKCMNCSGNDHCPSNCSSQPKCYHCGLNHKTGSRTCQEYKAEEEVLCIQARSKVSKAQAKLIFERENPSFRKMNFSETVKSGIPTTVKPKTAPALRERDVVCISPHSGRLYAATAPIEVNDRELEGTSECNPVLRKEAKEIFEEYDPESDLNNDVQLYQDELRKAAKRKNSDPGQRKPIKKAPATAGKSSQDHRGYPPPLLKNSQPLNKTHKKK